jgi:hypothetical protein
LQTSLKQNFWGCAAIREERRRFAGGPLHLERTPVHGSRNGTVVFLGGVCVDSGHARSIVDSLLGHDARFTIADDRAAALETFNDHLAAEINAH